MESAVDSVGLPSVLHPWSSLLHRRVHACLSQGCSKREPGWHSTEQHLMGSAEDGFAEGAGVPASTCILGYVLAAMHQLWPQ